MDNCIRILHHSFEENFSSISFQNKTCVHRLGLSCFLGSARGSISGKSEREARGDAAAPEDSGELDGRGDEPMAGEVCAAGYGVKYKI